MFCRCLIVCSTDYFYLNFKFFGTVSDGYEKLLFQKIMGNKSPIYFLKIIHKMCLRAWNNWSLDTEFTCWAAECLCERKQSRCFWWGQFSMSSQSVSELGVSQPSTIWVKYFGMHFLHNHQTTREPISGYCPAHISITAKCPLHSCTLQNPRTGLFIFCKPSEDMMSHA